MFKDVNLGLVALLGVAGYIGLQKVQEQQTINEISASAMVDATIVTSSFENDSIYHEDAFDPDQYLADFLEDPFMQYDMFAVA